MVAAGARAEQSGEPLTASPAHHDALAVLLAGAGERMRRDRPSAWYEPHDHGQRQFHMAPHRIRAMFPGNRWGKTTAMGVEVNSYVRHDERFTPKPKHPAQVLWFCTQFRQFDLLREQLHARCFDKGWTYNGSDNFYEWPGGDRLWIIPGDRDWTYIQGINPDLVCVDEECPVALWRELRARGFGDRATRYIVAATATMGAETWMKGEIYDPWLAEHARVGVDEARAMLVQRHPEIWCWPMGGIEDNPSMGADKVAGFQALTWSSDKEKQVRLRGGFQSWVGDPCFSMEGLDWLRAQRKAWGGTERVGWLEVEQEATNGNP